MSCSVCIGKWSSSLERKLSVFFLNESRSKFCILCIGIWKIFGYRFLNVVVLYMGFYCLNSSLILSHIASARPLFKNCRHRSFAFICDSSPAVVFGYILFSLRYNIRYGKVTASDDDVVQAADAADIHQKALTLKDGISITNLFISLV